MAVVREIQPRRATQKERDRVYSLLRYWQKEMYLDILSINVMFEDFCPDDEDDGETNTKAACIDVEASDEYHYAMLKIYPRFFEDDTGEQERVIVHELTHILVHPLAVLVTDMGEGTLVTGEQARKAEERVTDRLARIMLYGGHAPRIKKPLRHVKGGKVKRTKV